MEKQVRHHVPSRGLVVFGAGGRALAASVDDVAGLLDAESLATIPGRGAPMAGVLAFRGSVVPTLDLALALDPSASRRRTGYAIVLERGTDRFALLVGEMPRLATARDVVVLERTETAPTGASLADGDVADPSALDIASARGAAAASDPAETPAVTAVYDVRGERVEELDYWSLMDSVAPPAAFRLGGLGSR